MLILKKSKLEYSHFQISTKMYIQSLESNSEVFSYFQLICLFSFQLEEEISKGLKQCLRIIINKKVGTKIQNFKYLNCYQDSK